MKKRRNKDRNNSLPANASALKTDFCSKKHLILFSAVMLVICCSYLLSYFNQINAQKQTEYTLEQESYQSVTVQAQTIGTEFTPQASRMTSLNVLTTIGNDVGGTVQYLVTDPQTGEVLSKGNENIDQVKFDKGFSLKMQPSALKSNTAYRLQLTFRLNKPITVQQSVDGELKAQQVFEFTSGLPLKIMLLLLLLAFIGTVAVFLLKSSWPIHYKFLLLAAVVGLFAVVIVPPFSAPDEYRHFARAYDLAQGNFFVKTFAPPGTYPIATPALMDLPKEFQNMKLLGSQSSVLWHEEVNSNVLLAKWLNCFAQNYSGQTVSTLIHGTYDKDVLVYFPQIIMLLLAKLLHMSPMCTFYMARLGNLAFNLSASYFAIKYIPIFKNILFAVYFIPECLFTNITSSTDGMLLGVIFLLFAFVIRAKYRGENLWNLKSWGICLVFTIFIADLKLPYILLLGILCLLDRTQFRNSIRKKYAFLFSLLLCGTAFFAIVQHFMHLYAPQTDLGIGGHLSYFFLHPIRIGNLFLQTFLNSLFPYLEGALQFNAGFYLILLVLVSYFSFSRGMIGGRQKKIILFVTLAAWFGIMAAAYTWQAPDFGSLWGIQGRYFIPILLFAFFGFSQSENEEKDKNMAVYLPLVLSPMSVIFLMSVVNQFWVV